MSLSSPWTKAAASVSRHLAPLLVMAATGGSVLIYLLLALFDLGLSYSNHQLRKHWPELTTNAVAAAETPTERVFAHAQLPLMFVFGALAFIGTVALALVPFLVAYDLAPTAWAELKADGELIALTVAIMSGLASYGMHADMRKLGERWMSAVPAAENGADHTLMQLGMFTMIAMYALAIGGPGIGLWLLAGAFAAVQIWFDLRAPAGSAEVPAHAAPRLVAQTSRRRKR